MGYTLGGKNIDIHSRMTRIGSGQTGDVYKYKDVALKIFREDAPTPIDRETAEYLTSISTERVLLPLELLLYNSTFRGYSFYPVSKKGSGKRMINLPREELVDDILVVEEDITTISNKQVLLNGIEPSNCIFNGKFYISDPSKYRKLDTSCLEDLEEINQYQVHMLLSEMMVSEVRKLNLGPKYEKRMRELLAMKESSEDSSEFFEELLGPSETIKQFVKRI